MRTGGKVRSLSAPSCIWRVALWLSVLTLPLLGYSQTLLEPLWTRGATPREAQVAISQDGSTLVASEGEIAWYWRVSDGNLNGILSIGNDVSRAIAVSPDGSLIATSYFDAHVRLWRASDGALLGEFLANGIVHALSFSPNGTTLAVAAGMWRPSKVYLVDPATMTVFNELALSGYAYALAFSPNGEIIAVGDSTGKVTLWRLSEGIARELIGHTAPVRFLAFSPNGDLLASTSENGQVIVWNVAGETLLAQWMEPNGFRVPVAFAPGGAELAVATSTEIRLRAVPSGGLINTIPHSATSVAFTPEGTLVSDGEGIRFWQVPEGTLIDAYKAEQAFAWMPDSTTLVCARQDETLFRNAQQGTVSATLAQGANQIAVSPDGSLLALAERSGPILLWDLNTNTLLNTLTAFDRNLQLAFSPNGTYFASLGRNDQTYRNEIYVWQMPSANLLYTLTFPTSKTIFFFAFSPNSDLLAVVDLEGAVLLYRASDGELLATLQSEDYGAWEAYRVAFSPDGRLLAFSYSTRVEVWQVETGTLAYTLPTYPNQFAFSVATSPDGVLTVADSAHLSFWRMVDGAPLGTYRLARLTTGASLQFSPSGEYIALGDGSSVSVARNPIYRLPGDANSDGCVDESDLLMVLFTFGTDDTQADLNRDGVVDDADLLQVLFHFGSGC